MSDIISFLIVTLPFSIYYKAPFLVNNLSIFIEIIILLLILISALSCIKNTYINLIKINILPIWLLAISMIALISKKYVMFNLSYFNQLTNIIIVSIIICFSRYYINDKFIGIYQFISILCVIYIYFQIILFYEKKIILTGAIPFLKVDEVYYDFFHISYSNNIRFRPSSFFSEPSHYSLYILPSLCLLLFKESHRKIRISEIIYLIASSFSILLSGSWNGIIMMIIIYFYFIFYRLHNRYHNKVLTIVLIIICIAVIILQFNKIILSENVFLSLFSIKSEYRIWRGFDLYSKLPLFDKVFGIGYRNLTNYHNRYNISSIFDASNSMVNYEYLNMLSQILIYSGLIGLIIFIIGVIDLFSKSISGSRAIIICFIILGISSSILLDPTWMLYICLILASNQRRSYA